MNKIVIALSVGLSLLAVFVHAKPKHSEVQVSIISTRFLLPGKIRLLQNLARPYGVNVQAHYIDGGTDTVLQGFAKSDLVILDTPRGSDRARVMRYLQETIAESTTPWIAVGGGRPLSGQLAKPLAKTYQAYYAAGGENNLRHLMQFIQAQHAGLDSKDIPEPVPLPAAGFYHPQAPEFFSRLSDYQAWAKQLGPDGTPRWSKAKPVLAIAISASSIANNELDVYDELIKKTEQAGGIPLVFWINRRQPQSLRRLIADAQPSMIVNTTHMVGEGLKKELWQLNVPVVMGLNYRSGDRDQWRQAAQGLAASSAAALMVIPETWGMSDPLLLSAVENGSPAPIDEQLDLLVQRFMAHAKLRQQPKPEQRLALLFWNSPAGEKNLSASNLNVPRSMANISQALKNASYAVDVQSEEQWIARSQRMLSAYYRPQELDALLDENLAVTLPVKDYRLWLNSLPETVRQPLLTSWGEPEQHWSVRQLELGPHFIIPMASMGKLLYLPQPPRSDRLGEDTHSLVQAPGHLYLATYLYLRQVFAANAIIHLGTHGTQEWTPGKDRGLWAYDYPNLAVGNVPVFYPYIQDNIGEAMQAKRRGRAVTISHQTPPFAPSGFYDELLDMHDLMHQYQQLEQGAVRDASLASLLEKVKNHDVHKDLGWSEADIRLRSDEFIPVLHDHLHKLAQTSTPMGLHSFGEAADEKYIISTVMQQLGEEYYRALDLDTKEMFADSFESLFQSPAYRYLQAFIRGEKKPQQAKTADLQKLMAKAVSNANSLRQAGEWQALLAGLNGELVAPGLGGDPVRNPQTTSGTNLYAVDPNKIPSREAYLAAAETYQQLIDNYRDKHQGQWPDKLAFSLWSSEAIRTMGLSEAQIMHALGVKPVWGPGGRVVDLSIIPQQELKRPRVDTVIQLTSVYRDQFDGIMKKLAVVIERLSELNEAGNPLAKNSQTLMAQLQQKGLSKQNAKEFASARLFSNPPGSYGSGVTDVAMNSTDWDDDSVLADTFINSQSHIYSHKQWGTEVQSLGLLQSQLQGVDAVLLSRSSNLHGLLSTDHPFEYLGGLSAAVKSIDGNNPELYISNARQAKATIYSAAGFLSDELRTRYQNPQWIKSMQKEGYAGTVNILKVVNNLFGWQAMDQNMVRADQWQAMHDTYVMDQRELGLNQWFEQHNATAQAQLIERMLEAVRKGYWDAPEATRRQLIERWDTLVNTLDAVAGADKTQEFIRQQATGFGMQLNQGPSSESQNKAKAENQAVRGQVLEQVSQSEQIVNRDITQWIAWLLLFGSFIAGAYRGQRQLRAPSLNT